MKPPNFVRIAALALALAAAPFPALAQENFADEEITLIVPFTEGGGTDRWARFFAPRISKHLAGNPEVKVKNAPGPNGPIDAANEFSRDISQNSASHVNGRTLLGVSASVQFPYLLGDKRVKYDYEDWEVLLVSPSGGVVYVSPKLEVENALYAKRLAGIPLDYIAQSATGIDIVPLLAMELLGIIPRASFGARGRTEGLKHFQDGDVLIDFQTTPVYLQRVAPMVKNGDAFPLFSLGVLDRNGELKRDPSFPDIPHFGEVYRQAHGKEPDGKRFEIWKTLLAAGFSAQKMIFIQKSASDVRTELHRQSLRDVLSDPDFLVDAGGLLGKYPQHLDAQARRLKDLAIGVSPEKQREIGLWLVTDALPTWTAEAE